MQLFHPKCSYSAISAAIFILWAGGGGGGGGVGGGGRVWGGAFGLGRGGGLIRALIAAKIVAYLANLELLGRGSRI